MKMIRRLLSLLVILTLSAVCFPVAAEKISNLFHLRTFELFHCDELTITAGGTVRQSSEGFYIPVTVVNMSEKQIQLDFSQNQLLNGRYVCTAMDCISMIQPGQTYELELCAYRSVLEEYGITSLNQIASLKAEVWDNYPLGTCRVLGTVTLSAKLLGLSPRKVAPLPYADELEPQFLFEGDGIGVWLDGFSPDGSMLNICLINNRAEPAKVDVENINENGWQIPYTMGLNAAPGGTDWIQLQLGSGIPDYSGLASVTFDLRLLSRDAQASLEYDTEYYVALYDEPIHISLVPTHPADVPELEGWTFLTEQDGLQILYRDGFRRSKSNTILPLLIINTSEDTVWPSCLDDPYTIQSFCHDMGKRAAN